MKLLLLEDDARLGAATRDLLSLKWDVTWVTTIAAAREALTRSLFGACILDRVLPDGDATDLVTWMRRRRDATPVIMLTALGQLGDRVSGLDAGANDYLVKPFEFAELDARLRALTRTFTGGGVEIGSWVFYPAEHYVESPYTGRITLTERESALLGVLAGAPDRTFSRAQILSAVFDHRDSESTVDTYVHYVRRKLEPELIQTVRGEGYRLGTPA